VDEPNFVFVYSDIALQKNTQPIDLLMFDLIEIPGFQILG